MPRPTEYENLIETKSFGAAAFAYFCLHQN